LTALKGDEWRRARNIMTPTFTSGKMKMMMSLMNECVDELVRSFGKKADSDEDINVKDIFGFYTMDVVAKCAFATTTDVQEKEYESDFMKNAARFLFPSKFRIGFFMMMPRFIQSIFLKSGGGNTMGYLEKVVRSIIEQRQESGMDHQSYKDLLQLMIDAMKERLEKDETSTNGDSESHHINDVISNDSTINENNSKTAGRLSKDEVVANALLVLAAGYETTATLLTYASFSLAVNQQKQEILRKEVTDAFVADGNTFRYETLSTLKYLDAIISETLRLYPPVVRLERQCTHDYNLMMNVDGKNYDLLIKKGDVVRLPIYAIHRDSEYYEDPDEFEPERFLPENKDKITPYTYLPFGGGPRNCIGMRFALLEAKLALAKSVLNYRFVASPRTPKTPDYSRSGVLLSAHNMFLKVKRL
jgi:cytochrome P450